MELRKCPRPHCNGTLYRENCYYTCISCARRFALVEIEEAAGEHKRWLWEGARAAGRGDVPPMGQQA